MWQKTMNVLYVFCGVCLRFDYTSYVPTELDRYGAPPTRTRPRKGVHLHTTIYHWIPPEISVPLSDNVNVM